MEAYSLKDVKRVYSYYGKSPFIYNISSYIIFFGKEDFLRKRAIDKLDLKGGDRVLDLACGMGNNFYYLNNKVGCNGHIIGIDYTEEMLKVARKKAKLKGLGNIRLIKKDAAKLNFPKNYFDGIISTIGVSSIPKYKEALKKSINSLKIGKKIVILDGKLFDNKYKILNPIIKCLRWSKSWMVNADIEKYAKELLNDVKTEKFFGGSIYITSGTKIE